MELNPYLKRCPGWLSDPVMMQSAINVQKSLDEEGIALTFEFDTGNLVTRTKKSREEIGRHLTISEMMFDKRYRGCLEEMDWCEACEVFSFDCWTTESTKDVDEMRLCSDCYEEYQEEI